MNDDTIRPKDDISEEDKDQDTATANTSGSYSARSRNSTEEDKGKDTATGNSSNIAEAKQNGIVTGVIEGLGAPSFAEIAPPVDWLNEEVVVFTGLLGNAARDGYRRLYLNLQLNEYIEFKLTDVVHARDLGNDVDGFMVWFKKSATVQHHRVETVQLQRGFLQGDMIKDTWFSPNVSGWQTSAANSSMLCNGGGSVLCNGGGSVLCNGGGGVSNAGCF